MDYVHLPSAHCPRNGLPFISDLAACRLGIGLTQKDIVVDMDVTEGNVSRWERGFTSNLTEGRKELYRLVLGVDVTDFDNMIRQVEGKEKMEHTHKGTIEGGDLQWEIAKIIRDIAGKPNGTMVSNADAMSDELNERNIHARRASVKVALGQLIGSKKILVTKDGINLGKPSTYKITDSGWKFANSERGGNGYCPDAEEVVKPTRHAQLSPETTEESLEPVEILSTLEMVPEETIEEALEEMLTETKPMEVDKDSFASTEAIVFSNMVAETLKPRSFIDDLQELINTAKTGKEVSELLTEALAENSQLFEKVGLLEIQLSESKDEVSSISEALTPTAKHKEAAVIIEMILRKVVNLDEKDYRYFLFALGIDQLDQLSVSLAAEELFK